MKQKHPAILFIPGWLAEPERYLYLVEACGELGFVAAIVDFHWSEIDLAVFTRADFFAKVVAAYDRLAAAPGVDRDRITVMGSSFGGYLASVLTSERRVANLILHVPADYPELGFGGTVAHAHGSRVLAYIWKRLPRWSSGFVSGSIPITPLASRALAAVHKFAGNILVVESEKDEHIPRRMIQNYLAAAPNKNKLTHAVIKDAPHSLHGRPELKEQLKRIIVGWLGEK